MGNSGGHASRSLTLRVTGFCVRQVGVEDPLSAAAGSARVSRCSRGTRGSVRPGAAACRVARTGRVMLQVGGLVLNFPHSQISGVLEHGHVYLLHGYFSRGLLINVKLWD